MKIFVMIMALVGLLSAADLGWNDDYKKAVVEAKIAKKDIYMLITSSDCRWCRKFESTTLQDESVIEKLKEKYVLLHTNRDIDFIPEGFKTKRVPRHYLLTSKGEPISSFLGAWNKEDFFSFMKDAESKKQ